ncbi:sigma-70 family RNA polymerase sigma factor [Thermocrinis sp.]
MLKDENKEKEIVLKYLPLIKSLACRIHRHLPDTVDINDLIGHGILAVLGSIPKLDSNKNPDAYLRLRVKGAMYDYLRSLDFVSKGVRKKEKEIKAVLDKLTQELGREPTDEELMNALGSKPETFYSDLQKIFASHVLYLDEVFREGRTYEELFSTEIESPEERVIKTDLKEKVISAIGRLGQREQLVLQLLFYEEIPAKEVAKLLKVSTARVSQIKENALTKLREMLRDVI